ncbi:NADH dehydrogenase [ubiquinone] 1 alpha subcomplex assembly factor 3 [Amyelois transitella]|uniref:NADH dehydrogenase [ubiquinone] 1 alpha subcomplex assembly factor 3 n=1 Tax=Amyelois transitella TaxID=680683 RepID=UPI00298F43AC|nr:NADH dehydrogenase [ubiquinone] 1 alpha subcomplex assembly factor 3 [Amyelois transitella]
MLANRLRQIGATAVRQRPILRASYAKAAYEGEGKTTVRVLNLEPDLGLMIDAYATYGFRLNNGVTVLGPIAIFPRTVLSWQVRSSYEITEQSLKLFKILEPSIDVLIIGLECQDRAVINSAFKAARALGLNVELLSTEHACSTFNFLNAEGRSVAAACIPPLSITLSEDDMLQSKLHYENLYSRDLK